MIEIRRKRQEAAEMYPIELKEGRVPYLYFPLLDRTGLARSGFSTKLGGVSTGDFESMNLGVSRGDNPSCVRENFRRMGEAMGVKAEQMVLSWQTHTVNVRQVGEEDMGKGVTRNGITGMLTA